MPRLLALALAGLLALAAPEASQAWPQEPSPPDPADPPGPSLQDLLRRLRGEAEQQRATLERRVAEELEVFEQLGRDWERRWDRAERALVALGPPAGPLLLPYLEAGSSPKKLEVERSRRMAQVLAKINSPLLTDALLQAMNQGSLASRELTLQVLATSPEPDRVAPRVRDLYQRATGSLRRGALETLSRLGGEEASRLVRAALVEDDVALATVALQALAATRNREVLPQVLELCGQDRGRALVEPILAYLRAVPEAMDERGAVQALVDLAAHKDLLNQESVAILDHLRELEDLRLTRDVRKQVETLSGSRFPQVREAALAMLGRHGDRKAKRDLLEPYDAKVDRQPDWSAGYAERGAVYERLGDWGDAISDYTKALRYARAGRRDPEVYVGLARCQARLKKFKEAADTLSRSSLSFLELRALAQDAAFAAMLESRYRSAFKLPEDD